MDKHFQILLLLTSCIYQIQCQNPGYYYSTYTNPYQNSFAFATPNLKQIFTTKLANAPISNAQMNSLYNRQPQQFNLQQQFGQQQIYQQDASEQLSNLYNAYYQQQNTQPNVQPPSPNYYVNEPQQNDELLRQQYNLQLSQQQQQMQQRVPVLERFQAPFLPSTRDTLAQQQQQQQQNIQTENLLGVAYSPSTKVSQVKFDSGKLKYDF